jgi:zeaxanthin glucosyltransferase
MGLVVPSEVFALQPKRDGEPLIYASLGTLQNGLESVFSTIAESVSDRSGMQLVLSVRPALTPKGIRSLS